MARDDAPPADSSALAPRAPESVLARRPDLADEVADLAREAQAGATRRAHAADWKVWAAWCRENGVAALPATVETAAAFITDQGRSKALATVRRYVASIGKAHKLAGHPSPFSDPRVKTLVEGLKRRKGLASPNAKAAVTPEVMLRAVNRLAQDHAQGTRDRAVLLVGMTTAMRRSEICAVQIEDLAWRDDGVVLTIRRSKTDQYGAGRTVAVPRLDDTPEFCPVRALRAWLRYVHADRGPLFRGLKRNGVPKATALSAAEVGVIVKRGVVAAGLDPVAFGAHSLRAGYVTQARAAGQGWGEIMEQTGHRKVETAKRYDRGERDVFKATRATDVFRGAFGARGQDVAAFEALVDAFVAGAVKLERVGLPPPLLDPKALAEFQPPDPHRAICSSIARWMESRGIAWSAERRFLDCPGGIADVAAKDGSLYAEVGDTAVSKVIACLDSGASVILAPYAFDGVVGFLLSGKPLPEYKAKIEAAGKTAAEKLGKRWGKNNTGDER